MSDTNNPKPGDTHGYPIPGAFILIRKTAHHAREYAKLVHSFAADLDEYAHYLEHGGTRDSKPVDE